MPLRLLLVLGTVLSLFGGPATTGAQELPFCGEGESPTFYFGFAALHDQLGDAMGELTECPHTNPDNGDTLQHTSTGLGLYRAATNTPTFTNGSEHWGITSEGLVYWTGGSADPPGVTPPPVPAVQPQPTPTATPNPTPPPAPPPQPAPSEADVAGRVAPSVVEVITDEAIGSGVSVAGGILTNAHVVEDAGSITVATADGRTASATLLRIDSQADLALLQTSLSPPPLQMEYVGQQRQGDEVLVLGYPLDLRGGPGGQATLTRGLISSMGQEPDTGRALIRTDAAINPGNSGGAMVNMRGKLIGLTTFSLRNAENASFAVAADTMSAFLQAPQSAVNPKPPVALFLGDPRNIGLTESDFIAGSHWFELGDDKSRLGDGLYVSEWLANPFTDRSAAIVATVAVFPTLRSAQAAWSDAARPRSGESPISVAPIGDATSATANPGKHVQLIVTRARNVIVSVSEESAANQSNVDQIQTLVRHMVDRVNARAK